MKKILKYSFLIISSFLLLFLIASCGNSATSNSNKTSTDSENNNQVEPDDESNYYTVTWKNPDGEVLEIDENVKEGTMPEFNGKIKFTDTINQGIAEIKNLTNVDLNFAFKSWDKEVTPVTDNITYTARYECLMLYGL